MSRLRAKRWVRPSAVRHWPQVIEQGIYKLRHQCEHRCGALYELLNGSLVLGPESHARSRRIRSDGLINLESLLLSVLTSTDLRSGVVADPAQADGTCMRQLDVRAYGAPVEGERSLRRAERHARTLAHLGLLETIEQRHELPEQRYRSTPAVPSTWSDFSGCWGSMRSTPSPARTSSASPSAISSRVWPVPCQRAIAGATLHRRLGPPSPSPRLVLRSPSHLLNLHQGRTVPPRWRRRLRSAASSKTDPPLRHRHPDARRRGFGVAATSKTGVRRAAAARSRALEALRGGVPRALVVPQEHRVALMGRVAAEAPVTRNP